jgi:hypothetical protein
MGDHDNTRRYAFSLLGVTVVFAIVNAVRYWWRTPACCDWPYTTGIPFAFLQEGGFGGIRRLLWGGVVADVSIIFAITFIANRVATHRRTRRSITVGKRQLQAAIAGESWLPLKQIAIALLIITIACLISFLTKS